MALKIYDSAKQFGDYLHSNSLSNGLPGETPSDYFDDEVSRALELSRKIVELADKKI